ncbi:Pentatricopeptide repeat-containing protein [Forsythia ovata]|uniref:Pentatricopeptide repeat-containing protein n=1 Tax=Forsythia ovata TaxID=205694 RepID=A0ABD1UEH4_9LAMI
MAAEQLGNHLVAELVVLVAEQLNNHSWLDDEPVDPKQELEQWCKAPCTGPLKKHQHGTIEEARKVFASMRERKFLSEADVIVYNEIPVDHMKKNTAELVLSALKFFGLESKLKAKGCTVL